MPLEPEPDAGARAASRAPEAALPTTTPVPGKATASAWPGSAREASVIRGVAVKVGDPQFTLIWDTDADLDLHVIEPGGKEIYWEEPKGKQGGELDVDNTKGLGPENIYWLVESEGAGSTESQGARPAGRLPVVRRLLGRLRRGRQAHALEGADQACGQRVHRQRQVPRRSTNEAGPIALKVDAVGHCRAVSRHLPAMTACRSPLASRHHCVPSRRSECGRCSM